MANKDLVNKRLFGIYKAMHGDGAAEGGGNWTYYKAEVPGRPELRTRPIGAALGKVGELFGRMAYAGEGSQSRIQYQDERGNWHDVPQGWTPELDPETMQPYAMSIDEQMAPPRQRANGEDEDLQALLNNLP